MGNFCGRKYDTHRDKTNQESTNCCHAHIREESSTCAGKAFVIIITINEFVFEEIRYVLNLDY